MVRTIEHPDGLPLDQLPAILHAELRRANRLTERQCGLLLLAYQHGVQFVVENPAPRHHKINLGGALFYSATARHGSLWTTTPVHALAARVNARLVTFAFCRLGKRIQKYIMSLMYTPDLHATLNVLAPRLYNQPANAHILPSTAVGLAWGGALRRALFGHHCSPT